MHSQAKKEATKAKRNKPKVAIYFCNGIGNLLMMTPAIQALSLMYDNSKIDVVMPSEWNDYRAPIVRQVLEGWDLINKIISFPKDKFDIGSYKLLFTSAHGELSQASALFGQKGNPFEKAKWLDEYPHEVEYYMNEVYKLGYKGITPPIVAPMASKPILKGSKPRIAFYNGAANLSNKYRWGRKKWGGFADLAQEVYNYYEAEIICLGGKGEKEEGQELANKFDFVTNYAGSLSFLESVKALSQCDLMVSTDSALMHAAEAVKVPVVVLFGATLVSKNRPYFGEYEIVRGKCEFAPCQSHFRFQTCNDFICMKNITTGHVMNAVRKLGVLQCQY